MLLIGGGGAACRPDVLLLLPSAPLSQCLLPLSPALLHPSIFLCPPAMEQPRRRSRGRVGRPMALRPQRKRCRQPCLSSSYSPAAYSPRGSGSHTRTSESCPAVAVWGRRRRRSSGRWWWWRCCDDREEGAGPVVRTDAACAASPQLVSSHCPPPSLLPPTLQPAVAGDGCREAGAVPAAAQHDQ